MTLKTPSAEDEKTQHTTNNQAITLGESSLQASDMNTDTSTEPLLTAFINDDAIKAPNTETQNTTNGDKTIANQPKTLAELSLQAPHNIAIEQALLAALMNIEDGFDNVHHIVHANDFYGERHRHIFSVIEHLWKAHQPYDALSVFEALSRQDLLEKAGGEKYLMQIEQTSGTMFNLPFYAQKVRELAIYRQLIECGNHILDLAYHPKQKTLPEIIDSAESKIFAINEFYRSQGDSKQGVKHVQDIIDDVVSELEERQKLGLNAMIGVSTGFQELDNKMQGLQKGHLIVLAARPAMGKTALSLNIVQSVIEHELPVVFFSMEMSNSDIVMRLLSAWSGVTMSKVRSGQMDDDEWSLFNNGVSRLTNSRLYIDDRNNVPPSEMRSVCRRIAKDNNGQIGLVVVDYLQLMKISGYDSNNRVGETSEISRSLKALARELDCPVLALAQLNRNSDQRPSKRPMMSDLRESGAIEQDADIILFIYRDEVYFPNKKGNKGVAEIIIGKNRSGAIGRAILNFEGQYTRFTNPEVSIAENYDELE